MNFLDKRNKIKNKYHYFLIALITIMYFVSMPLQQPLKAVSVIYDFGFEGVVTSGNITQGLPLGSDNIFTSKKQGNWSVDFATNSLYNRSGNRCFYFLQSKGWFNATYSKIQYMTNWSCYYKTNFVSVPTWFGIDFYNKTLGKSLPIIQMNFSNTGNEFYYKDSTGTKQTIVMGGSTDWNILGFSVLNDIGDVRYTFGGATVQGDARQPTLINSGYRIDNFFITTSGSSGISRIDDMNWTLSSNYNGTGGSTGGCDELYKEDQWVGSGFSNCLGTVTLIDVLIPTYIESFVELVNSYEVSAKISGFELAISTYMDNDLSNYFLYINGMSLGNPCEMEGFVSGSTSLDKLKWDITGLTLTNESLVIELYYSGGSSWRLGYNGQQTIEGPAYPDACIYHSHNNYIDGIMNYNITQVTKRAMYKVYFSDVENPIDKNPNYINTIVVEGNGGNVSDGIEWTYIYDTVFFNVFVNDTIYDYYINVYKNGVPIGTDQYYPIDITKYQETHGYSPNELGLYKVYLLREGDYEVLNVSFWVLNTTKLYNLYTAPNPSFMNNDYTVYVDIDDGEIYNIYYARVFVYSSTAFDYYSGFGGSVINTIGSLTSFNFAHTEGNLDFHYWRLFGSNDNITFLPLGDVYSHMIDRSFVDSAYLTLSDYSIYLGQSTYIIGYHPIGLNYKVYIGSVPSFDVTGETAFNEVFRPSTTGVYTITLKQKVGDEWITPNNDCIATLTVSENPDDDGDGDDDDDDGDNDNAGDNDEEKSYNLLIGIMAVLGFGVGVAVILHHPMGFFIGSIPLTYALSSSALNNFQLLPSNVGIGLIVVLVLVAVIVWFLD